MKIRTQHQNIGAALMQIAEHDSFTAINPLKLRGEKITNAFLINTDTCVFLKYGNEPKPTGEYQFTFTEEQLLCIEEAEDHYKNVFVCLVCVEAQEICGLTVSELNQMISARKSTVVGDEESYQVLVTATQGGRLRAYTNAAGRKLVRALTPLVISRSRFPAFLFD
ncbi:hypothetical protein CJF43_23440 [Pseudomonas fragi]|uniref:Uncharacterized protein n=1 Tax=Pseudomonas fragi TaxID=296 RepID=A0A266LMT7_PSEFR|nr:hypothetical protein [Pseudomonas fragi]OZY39378.1 hypothetical protein CJF43_23440 [Pseudomonas fragi]